ncbi:CBS domain containing-hemolysin-like protein [Microbacterium halimionae]|uniref:CBS domain containing-hemolysin-like protein n=1 Tax=Microbacterium halimionae TaxID=1526413 RepID=A0A7W3JQZ1_9MICO|nr:hemolysin family protein [Microbacterium halimionae]MBA8817419.1 CBS domain containing-hemolysin-like protein [Microbacterium halimionae]NII96053.1 CBS domain containing-hemolysin-like protein [Microbacterium halimionae]
MNAWIVLPVTALLIVLSGFFVVIEFALLGARRHRLEMQAASSKSARAALRGMNELTVMLAGAQLGITVCTLALGAVTKPAVDGLLGPLFETWGAPDWLSGGAAFVLSLLAVTFLHLVVGEMAPKSWAIAHPEFAAKIIGIPSRAFVWPLRPFLLWVNRIANALVARTGVQPVDSAAVGGRDADTIRNLVEYSSQVGVLEPDLRTEITKVIELQTVTVDQLTEHSSTPTSVAHDASVADVQAAALESGHLRVLLTGEGGQTPAVVHVRDTLLADQSTPAAEYARQALSVDATTPVYDLLRQMREMRVQLAVVEDDGEFKGVVTLTDVVERVLPSAKAA